MPPPREDEPRRGGSLIAAVDALHLALADEEGLVLCRPLHVEQVQPVAPREGLAGRGHPYQLHRVAHPGGHVGPVHHLVHAQLVDLAQLLLQRRHKLGRRVLAAWRRVVVDCDQALRPEGDQRVRHLALHTHAEAPFAVRVVRQDVPFLAVEPRLALEALEQHPAAEHGRGLGRPRRVVRLLLIAACAERVKERLARLAGLHALDGRHRAHPSPQFGHQLLGRELAATARGLKVCRRSQAPPLAVEGVTGLQAAPTGHALGVVKHARRFRVREHVVQAREQLHHLVVPTGAFGPLARRLGRRSRVACVHPRDRAVGARLEQLPHHRDVPAAGCGRQRRVAGALNRRRVVEPCAGLDEHAHVHRPAPLGTRDEQRVLGVIDALDVGAAREQHLQARGALRTVALARLHRGVGTVGIARVHVCAARQQQLNVALLPALRSDHQRRLGVGAAALAAVYGCARVEERLQHIREASRPEARRRRWARLHQACNAQQGNLPVESLDQRRWVDQQVGVDVALGQQVPQGLWVRRHQRLDALLLGDRHRAAGRRCCGGRVALLQVGRLERHGRAIAQLHGAAALACVEADDDARHAVEIGARLQPMQAHACAVDQWRHGRRGGARRLQQSAARALRHGARRVAVTCAHVRVGRRGQKQLDGLGLAAARRDEKRRGPRVELCVDARTSRNEKAQAVSVSTLGRLVARRRAIALAVIGIGRRFEQQPGPEHVALLARRAQHSRLVVILLLHVGPVGDQHERGVVRGAVSPSLPDIRHWLESVGQRRGGTA